MSGHVRVVAACAALLWAVGGASAQESVSVFLGTGSGSMFNVTDNGTGDTDNRPNFIAAHFAINRVDTGGAGVIAVGDINASVDPTNLTATVTLSNLTFAVAGTPTSFPQTGILSLQHFFPQVGTTERLQRTASLAGRYQGDPLNNMITNESISFTGLMAFHTATNGDGFTDLTPNPSGATNMAGPINFTGSSGPYNGFAPYISQEGLLNFKLGADGDSIKVTQAQISIVPEPVCCGLLGALASGLVLIRRRAANPSGQSPAGRA
jgi:hypothetical protein